MMTKEGTLGELTDKLTPQAVHKKAFDEPLRS
jgi:hypothetical protein